MFNRKFYLLPVCALISWSVLADTTLRIVVHADLKILDPSFTPSYITRNFGHMVFETPFALDAGGAPQPQMVESFVRSKDGRQWTFKLREKLKFSDGTAVTADDVVASLERWAGRDSIGRSMSVLSGARWEAQGDRVFKLSLREPFPLVLEGLAKPSGFPPVIMPQRLARQPTTAPLGEPVGSGPYVLKRDEWVPGSKVVFVRNPHYVPRAEPPSGLAGGKKALPDRVEWRYLPDPNSALAALRKGEVDLIESVPPDFIGSLRADPNVSIVAAGAWQAMLVMNHLHPPFNDVRVRRAVMAAMDQSRFVAAMGYPLDMRVTRCASFFLCGDKNETVAGLDGYPPPSLARGRELLAQSGYRGEPVVVLVPTDVRVLNAAGLVAADTLRSLGMTVETQSADWATLGARRTRRDAPQAGGWSALVTVVAGVDADSPITNAYLSPACGSGVPGWPCDAKLDELRLLWLREGDPARRRIYLDQFHRRAVEAVPYVNVGQFYLAMAARRSLGGAERLWNGIPLPWILQP